MSKNIAGKLKIIDISGYSFTGKSAFHDLLCEFNGFYSHGREFEFDILRIQNGILDLQTALVGTWSPIRSSEAIRNFYRLIDVIGGNRSFWSKLTSSGAHYDYYFPNFTRITTDYANSLVKAQWTSDWPFALYNNNRSTLIAKKILQRLGYTKKEDIYLARLKPEEFNLITRSYFTNLFNSVKGESKYLILNNAFEPFSPEESIALFHDAKSIVVDRDPRDIYISASNAEKSSGMQVGQAVIGDSIEHFIERFKVYREQQPHPQPNVYRTNFESLVTNYDAEINKIKNFLGESHDINQKKGTIFNPNSSIKNIQQWKRLTNQKLRSEVDIIHKELNEYCLDI